MTCRWKSGEPSIRHRTSQCPTSTWFLFGWKQTKWWIFYKIYEFLRSTQIHNFRFFLHKFENFVFNNIFQLYDFEAEFKARREYDEMQSEAATASKVSESVPKQKEPERRQDEFIPAVESTSNQDSATPAPMFSATASSSSSFTTVCHFQITVRCYKFSHSRMSAWTR